jgi:hypothetical protein
VGRDLEDQLIMRRLITLAAAGGALLLCGAWAEPSPATTVSSAGTTFLSAVTITESSPVTVPAVTGDYLYWKFTVEAGRRPDVTATVKLPPAADRTGTQDWTIEVFDGLRRRQACVAGEQSPVAAEDAGSIALRCQLRQVRSWAEPWDGDPLPGTYYVRLSSTDLPEKDLGLPLTVDLRLATAKGDTGDDNGTLAEPLNPADRPGQIITAPSGDQESTALAADDDPALFDWVPAFSSRWFWTAAGGILAAVTGIIGFGLTRRPRTPRTP